MKFTLTFKTPDVFDQISDSVSDEDGEEEEIREKAQEFARQFVQYSEYVNIQFDTEAGTATVLKLRRGHDR